MRTRTFHGIMMILAAMALLVGCSTGGESDTSLEISDLVLEGTIEGKSFTFESGYAEDSIWDPGVDYFVELYNIAPSTPNPWDLDAYSSPYQKVSFSVPQAVGTYDLYWNFSTGEYQTVTLYDTDSGTNYICTEGSIRIDSIAGGVITGGLVALSDDANYVNGIFSVNIAP
jgi:hypothetical protein